MCKGYNTQFTNARFPGQPQNNNIQQKPFTSIGIPSSVPQPNQNSIIQHSMIPQSNLMNKGNYLDSPVTSYQNQQNLLSRHPLQNSIYQNNQNDGYSQPIINQNQIQQSNNFQNNFSPQIQTPSPSYLSNSNPSPSNNFYYNQSPMHGNPQLQHSQPHQQNPSMATNTMHSQQSLQHALQQQSISMEDYERVLKIIREHNDRVENKGFTMPQSVDVMRQELQKAPELVKGFLFVKQQIARRATPNYQQQQQQASSMHQQHTSNMYQQQQHSSHNPYVQQHHQSFHPQHPQNPQNHYASHNHLHSVNNTTMPASLRMAAVPNMQYNNNHNHNHLHNQQSSLNHIHSHPNNLHNNNNSNNNNPVFNQPHSQHPSSMYHLSQDPNLSNNFVGFNKPNHYVPQHTVQPPPPLIKQTLNAESLANLSILSQSTPSTTTADSLVQAKDENDESESVNTENFSDTDRKIDIIMKRCEAISTRLRDSLQKHLKPLLDCDKDKSDKENESESESEENKSILSSFDLSSTNTSLNSDFMNDWIFALSEQPEEDANGTNSNNPAASAAPGGTPNSNPTASSSSSTPSSTPNPSAENGPPNSTPTPAPPSESVPATPAITTPSSAPVKTKLKKRLASDTYIVREQPSLLQYSLKDYQLVVRTFSPLFLPLLSLPSSPSFPLISPFPSFFRFIDLKSY